MITSFARSLTRVAVSNNKTTFSAARSFASSSRSPSQLRPLAASTHPGISNHDFFYGSSIVTQHPATPVFIGFAKFPLPVIMDDSNLTVAEEAATSAATTTTATTTPKLELRKSNRNNRSSKNNANKGKRPCNRQGRRNRKIKIGRRKRS
mgnify:CR=1 FL=1